MYWFLRYRGSNLSGGLSVVKNMFNNIDIMSKGLDASWLRNQVITNNIANVDTPGFKSARVAFESVFKSALEQGSFTAKKTRAGHIDFSSSLEDTSSMVIQNTGTTMRLDGNNVDIDYENAELAKNTIYYNTLVQQISSELRRLSMAINEGK